MIISVQDIIELVVVVTTIKLIVSRYQPPVQESLQAIICIGIGTVLAMFVNPTPDGFVTGIVGSGLAFYGSDLVEAFRKAKEEITDIADDVKEIQNVTGIDIQKQTGIEVKSDKTK